jgi:hypothetical protein
MYGPRQDFVGVIERRGSGARRSPGARQRAPQRPLMVARGLAAGGDASVSPASRARALGRDRAPQQGCRGPRQRREARQTGPAEAAERGRGSPQAEGGRDVVPKPSSTPVKSLPVVDCRRRVYVSAKVMRARSGRELDFARCIEPTGLVGLEADAPNS